MQDLISILYDFLEKNASIERMVKLKRLAKKEYAIVTELLCNLFSGLSPQKAIKFLNMQLAAAIRLYRTAAARTKYRTQSIRRKNNDERI